MRLFRLATVIGHLRVVVAGQHQVGVGLVIPKQDVVLGGQRLDQIVFQNQRLRFRAGDGGFDAGNLSHHQLDAW